MARDKFHDNVRIALEKEGWHITAEQLRINLGKASIEIDLMAENLFAAERAGEKIAVEVKSFLEKSIIHTFHEAMGQYLDYRSALEVVDPERVVYLAVPNHIYHHDVFKIGLSKNAFGKRMLNLLFLILLPISSNYG